MMYARMMYVLYLAVKSITSVLSRSMHKIRVVIEIVMIDKHPGSGGCCNLQPRSKLTINRKSTILYSPPSKSLRSTFSLLIQILDGDLQICYAWE